jgi:hypothetical protein
MATQDIYIYYSYKNAATPVSVDDTHGFPYRDFGSCSSLPCLGCCGALQGVLCRGGVNPLGVYVL